MDSLVSGQQTLNTVIQYNDNRFRANGQRAGHNNHHMYKKISNDNKCTVKFFSHVATV